MASVMPAESARATRASLREIRFAIETSVKLVAKSGAPAGQAVELVCDRRGIRFARDRFLVLHAVSRRLARERLGSAS